MSQVYVKQLNDLQRYYSETEANVALNGDMPAKRRLLKEIADEIKNVQTQLYS